MSIKYLAYLALLAGWIIFCYWLYAKGIAPRWQQYREKSHETLQEDIPFPLAFRWSSSIPLRGKGFDSLRLLLQQQISHYPDDVILANGYYFRDEMKELADLDTLGLKRISNAADSLNLPAGKWMGQTKVQEITADVRTQPFEAVTFEVVRFADLFHVAVDTLECCFPLGSVYSLPEATKRGIERWLQNVAGKPDAVLNIVGTASGNGIAEPMDLAMERALAVKEIVINAGWKEEHLRLSTGQRNHPIALRNRCVVMFIE